MEQAASFIKPLSFHISQNQIFAGISILGLGLFTYLTKRYLNTEKETTNQYYTKQTEIILGAPNINLLTETGQQQIIYLFWNGDINSTYLLIDLLLQDKIIQPLYIERYTILKSLEYHNLEILTKQYNEYNSNKKIIQLDENINQIKKIKKIKEYLEDVAKIKKKQTYEITQLELFRNIINKQYPEFKQNLLPTQYITTINKDLDHSSKFFEVLKTISPLYYNGIEFLEQVLRFIKHNKAIKSINSSHSRILLGYTKDSKNTELVNKILARNILDNIKIEVPLTDMTNNDIKYLSANVLPNNIMKYFKQQ
jgi:hypothetical protein